MSMTIQERIALQARMAQAGRKSTPKPASPAPAPMSVAQRIAQQTATARAVAAARPKITPPPDHIESAGISAAERIAMQTAAVAQAKNKINSGMASEEVIAMYRAQYQDFLAKLETMDFGEMFFGAKPAEPVDAGAAEPNGISTAEGEAVLPAAEQVQVNTYQATPVIAPARARRKRKAEAAKAEEKPAEEPAAEVVESTETEG